MAGGKGEFSLKEIKPNIGGCRVSGANETLTSSYDLVEQMQFLYVRIEKAVLPPAAVFFDPYVEIKIGNYRATTFHLKKKQILEWNQVFAFTRDRLHSTAVEITVRDKLPSQHQQLAVLNESTAIGKVTFNLPADIPTCLPPDSPLAPQWYKLDDKNIGGELMLAIWFGTQADNEYLNAYHSDAAIVTGDGLLNTRSMVYLSPKLWYLRVSIIQADDLVPAVVGGENNKNRNPEVYVKAILGDVILRTKVSPDKNVKPKWNEDLMFVVAEPFGDHTLILSVEDKVENNVVECIRKCKIRLSDVQQRIKPEPAGSKWFDLEQMNVFDQRKELNFYSKLNARISLDGGYHVFDEMVSYASDFRSSAKSQWPSVLGVLELGIISGSRLLPMKLRFGRETTDAYCVAKYGLKWVKTRTVVDSLAPKWNEQYSWDVYDPCTVLTIGVFDDCHLHGGNGKDLSIGKVRIRVSTLWADRIYTYSYPLLVLQPNGVKKMGEIQLAVRFTCISSNNLYWAYKNSLFPKMHYVFPLSAYQLDSLRQKATSIICSRLSQNEPPLRKEVVEYILGGGSQMWSVRKAKVNRQRLSDALYWFKYAWEFFEDVRKWKNPWTTCVVGILYFHVVYFPDLTLLLAILFCFVYGISKWWKRPRNPTHIDIKLSFVDSTTADELDEEMDTYPSSRESDVLKMRYDRLRNYAATFVTAMGDFASRAEQYQSLLNWHDPRLTAVFLGACLAGAFLCYNLIGFKCFLLLGGWYSIRHPKFGYDNYNVFQNLMSRLPSKEDYML